MKELSILLIFILITNVALAQRLEDMKWITEEYPPGSYLENGEIKGILVDILLEIWKKVGLQKTRKDIEVKPWARGLKMLESDPMVCLFGMGISEKRKEKYRFVGRIPLYIRVLIAKKEKKYQFDSITDINNKIEPGRIGVTRGDIGGTTFINQGGNANLVYTVSKGKQQVLMLKSDRIDVMAYTDIPTYKIMRDLGINRADYEIVYVFSQGNSGYAFNKQINLKILRKMQKAFDDLVANGTVMRIRTSYVDNL